MPSWSQLINEPSAFIIAERPLPDAHTAPRCVVPWGRWMGIWRITGLPGRRRLFRADMHGWTPYMILGDEPSPRMQFAIGQIYKAFPPEVLKLARKLSQPKLIYKSSRAQRVNDVWVIGRLVNALGMELVQRHWEHHGELLCALAQRVRPSQRFRPTDGIRDIVRHAYRLNKQQARRVVQLWSRELDRVGTVGIASGAHFNTSADFLSTFVKARVNWGRPTAEAWDAVRRLQQVWYRQLSMSDVALCTAAVGRSPELLQGVAVGASVYRLPQWANDLRDEVRFQCALRAGTAILGGDVQEEPLALNASAVELLRVHHERFAERINQFQRGALELQAAVNQHVFGLMPFGRTHRLTQPVCAPFTPMPNLAESVTKDGITFTPLLTSEALAAESAVMHHCVDSYASEAARGLCAIFHVESELHTVNGKALKATMEIRAAETFAHCGPEERPEQNVTKAKHLQVTQIRGVCNAEIPLAEQFAVRRVFQQLLPSNTTLPVVTELRLNMAGMVDRHGEPAQLQAVVPMQVRVG